MIIRIPERHLTHSMPLRFITLLLAISSLVTAASAQDLPPGVQVVREAYGKNDPANLLDLYLPPNRQRTVPVIVWIHGGGWELGSKGIWPGISMVDKGFAVASINYRLSGEAKFPAQILDCRAAVRWLRSNRVARKYHLDPDHIGVWGESAGGHLAALLGTSSEVDDRPGPAGSRAVRSSRVQAVVDWCGPTDVEKWTEFQASFAGLPPDYPNQGVARLLGGGIERMREPARKANPITFISGDEPPFLIMHGDRDSLVPVSQSELLANALKKAGTQVEFKILPGKGHETFSDAESLRQVEKFFDRTLRSANGKDNKVDEEVKLLATYNHQAGDQPAGPVEFYSNFRIQSPESMNTWRVSGTRFVMCWYDPKSPTGVWVDTCDLAKNGKSYDGRNQFGGQIHGELIGEGNLRTTAIRIKTSR